MAAAGLQRAAALQGVPVRNQDHGLHCAQAECGALNSALAGGAPELRHERDPAPHEKPPLPHQLHEVGFFCPTPRAHDPDAQYYQG